MSLHALCSALRLCNVLWSCLCCHRFHLSRLAKGKDDTVVDCYLTSKFTIHTENAYESEAATEVAVSYHSSLVHNRTFEIPKGVPVEENVLENNLVGPIWLVLDINL